MRLDQPLVLELLQRGVDRAWARLPGPTAAVRDLRDDLIAVHRLDGEHVEDRCAHVTAAHFGSPLLGEAEQSCDPRRRARTPRTTAVVPPVHWTVHRTAHPPAPIVGTTPIVAFHGTLSRPSCARSAPRSAGSAGSAAERFIENLSR